MKTNKVTAVIFEGGQPTSEIAHSMVQLRSAMVKDNIERFNQVKEIDKVIVVTNYPKLRDELASFNAIVDFSNDEFHFGKRLKQIINHYDLDAVFYLGGAAGPLISTDEISAFAQQVITEPGTVLTNNVQSADLVVFSPAKAINKLPVLPIDDNPLANRLRDVGLHKVLMPHSTGIHFDIDTPTDMLVLSIHPSLGRHTQEFFKNAKYDNSNLIRAKHILALPYADVLMSGRIGSPVITQINTYIRCRLRVFSEERGMKSLERDKKGLVKSLFGHTLDLLGTTEFFKYLSSLAHVAFIDSRVLFAHNKLHLTDNDRFYSDLLMPEHIENPWVRQFTEDVLAAPIPIVLGGHSLVAGGMWSIIDTLLHERHRRYCDNKLYQLIIPDYLTDKQLGMLIAKLPRECQVYGVTSYSRETQKSYTYVQPNLKISLDKDWYLHIAAPIDIIKNLENQGWSMR